jgi:serine/threonine protein kinase, bacterial
VTHSLDLVSGAQPIPGYRLRQRLGVGGFGQVWEADGPGGVRVALKFLPCKSSQNTTQELKSLQAIRLIRHPHLVRIDQVWCHLGYVVVGMELAEGTLFDLLQLHHQEIGGGLEAAYACFLLAQAATGLDYLNTHRHRINDRLVTIQHCDVKPSNLLLFGDRVKVADFGLSSSFISRLSSHKRAGTVDYAAPEIFQGRLSEQADQYSLAVTYCQLRGGRLPFPEGPRQFSPTYARPEPDLSMLTPEERPIVARALCKNPPERWACCGELMARLTRAVGAPVAAVRA